MVIQGSNKVPFGSPRQVDVLAGQVALKAFHEDKGNHLRFPKPVLPIKQFLLRLCGYRSLLEPKSFNFNNNFKRVIYG